MRGGGFEEPDMAVIDVVDVFLGYSSEGALVVSNGLRNPGGFGDKKGLDILSRASPTIRAHCNMNPSHCETSIMGYP